jgi:hypothetical protein
VLSLMDEPFFKYVYYPTIKVNKHYKYLKHSFHVNTYLGGQPEESLELLYLSLAQTLIRKVVSFDVLLHALMSFDLKKNVVTHYLYGLD